MKKQNTKKIFSLIILSAFLMQALVPSFAFAEKALDYDNPNKNGDNPYKVSLKGVLNSGMLTSLVGCTGIVDKVSKVTTKFIQDALASKTGKAKTRAELEKAALKDAVPGVNTEEAIKQYEQQQKQKERDDSKAFTDNCLNGIATTLAKNQLTAMTKYTMNWITTGFNGDPLYVRDVNSYMDSLTTEILKEENKLFKDPANAGAYPYGRDYAIGQVNAYKSAKDTYGALKQDLTSYLVPGATPQSFATDFSQGGKNPWNAWLALTQHPENNPLGFTLKATENLGQKKSNAVETAKAEIDRGGGVIDQKKCVEYEKVTFSGARMCNGVPLDELPPGTVCNSPTTAGTPSAPKCIKYETVTPGSIIKGKIDTYINSPERQLELAKTLNDSLNALFSILITKFQDQGLSGLKSKTNNFTNPVSGGFGSNSITDSFGNTMSSGNNLEDEDSGPNRNVGPIDLTRDLGNKYTQATNGGAWNANTNTPELDPESGIKNQYYVVSTSGYTKLFAGNHHWLVGQKAFFDGTKWKVGVPNHIIETKGIFQIQKDYVKSIKKASVILPQVLPKLAELDYCVPGPNQNWKNVSEVARDEYFNYLSGVGVEYISDVYDSCPFTGCDGIQTIGGWLNGGLDHSYNVISLPDSSGYEALFDDARNLWDKIVTQEFYWIARNDVHMTYTFSSDHWAVNPVVVQLQVKKWLDLATLKYNEYVTKAEEIYGINSPMRTEFTPEGYANSSFLPMAQAGLDLTKNIVTDAEDITIAMKSAEENLAQSNGAVYRLGFIKDKINVIVSAAQLRRKTRRIADGLPPVPQICLDNEKVTWVEISATGNDVLKY